MRLYVYILVIACNLALTPLLKWESNFLFWGLTIELFLINLIEVIDLYRRERSYFFINPVVFGAGIIFGLASGAISNVFMIEDGQFRVKELTDELSRHREWLNYFMMYANIGAIMMWWGYRMNWASYFMGFLKSVGYKTLWSGQINMNRLWIIILVAYTVKFYLFSIGLFGRIVDEEYFVPGEGYQLGSQIRILGDLSLLTFIIVTYLFYKNRSLRNSLLFYACLSLELFFAFLYGARAPFLYPFIIIFVVHYYLNNRIQWSLVLLIIVPVIAAFSFVASFKQFSLSIDFKRSSNPIAMYQDYRKYMSALNQKSRDEFADNISDKILESSNFVCEGASAIRFQEEKSMYTRNPDFKLWLLKSPIDAFVPLFLQPIKNSPAWGLWFKNTVLKENRNLKYSIAFSNVGYFYLTGGVIMIFIGFFLYGIILKIMYKHLFEGVFGLVIFIMALEYLYTTDVFSTIIVYFLRTVILYPIIVRFLYSKW